MKKQILLLSLTFVAAVVAGRWLRQPQSVVSAAAPAACQSSVTIKDIQRFGADGNSENYLVTWTSGLPCLNQANVGVDVTLRDGTVVKEANYTIQNETKAVLKVRGIRPDNPAVRATARVNVLGHQQGAASGTATS